jgi:hypothetical protein
MPSKPEVLKARRANDPEYAERVRNYSRKWREANLEKARELDVKKASSKRSESRDAYNAYMRDWTAKNKDRLNAERREQRANDPERTKRDNERRKKAHHADPDKKRNAVLKRTYGITLKEYRQLYDLQEGKCAICECDRPDSGTDGLVVDHCHDSGLVRKLLCAYCNTGLGQFKDDVSLLQKAIEYLNKFKE